MWHYFARDKDKLCKAGSSSTLSFLWSLLLLCCFQPEEHHMTFEKCQENIIFSAMLQFAGIVQPYPAPCSVALGPVAQQSLAMPSKKLCTPLSRAAGCEGAECEVVFFPASLHLFWSLEYRQNTDKGTALQSCFSCTPGKIVSLTVMRKKFFLPFY